jgi:hypothetical protein
MWVSSIRTIWWKSFLEPSTRTRRLRDSGSHFMDKVGSDGGQGRGGALHERSESQF